MGAKGSGRKPEPPQWVAVDRRPLDLRKLKTARGGNPKYVKLTHDPETGACLGYVLKEPAYQFIADQASELLPLVLIAYSLGINDKTFRTICERDERAQQAIDLGRGAIGAEAVDSLVQHMRNGSILATTIIGKHKLGWREQTGEVEGARVTNNSTVNIQINAPMSAEEFAKLTEVANVPALAAPAPVKVEGSDR